MKHIKKLLVVLFSFFLAFIITSCDEPKEHVHNDVSKVEVIDPTCTEGGYTIYHCNECDSDYNTLFVNALGHDNIVSKQGKVATCTENGLSEEIKCNRCGHVSQEQTTIVALGHDYGEWEFIDPINDKPTTTKEGLLTKICKNNSSHVVTQTLPNLQSNYYDVSLENATCLKTVLQLIVAK